MDYRTLSLLFISILALTQGEIHRAKSTAYKSPKRASNARDQSVDVAVDREMPASAEAEEAAVKLLAEENFGSSDVWIYSIVGAILVGSSGILPLLILPIEAGPSLRHGAPAARLKLMLSFAVGSLLGDVFCHLLPEVWNYLDTDDHKAHTRIGLWIIAGLLFFMIVEKILGDETEFEPLEDTCDEMDCPDKEVPKRREAAQNKHSQAKKGKQKNQQQKNQSHNLKINSHKQPPQNSQSQSRKRNIQKQNSSQRTEKSSVKSTANANLNNNKSSEMTRASYSSPAQPDQPHIKVSGYLNLFANVVDNFTHGLAVAGSFLVSKRVGLLTTGAILVHEIPHEVGDFAILLRSGFDRWRAAKAQVLTATGGVFGAITALTAEQAGERTAWILAFTSGGFLYIALVTVVPDLLQERHGRESLKQIFCIIFGILCMIFVTYFSG
ncbi:zinc transporter ZIP13-like [Babylonia areolata]|uniref:zinc transporter ZIP13-like n=1 Tax=Babylonia areolata TaxID=304850 RepID=UPI003FD4D07B